MGKYINELMLSILFRLSFIITSMNNDFLSKKQITNKTMFNKFEFT